MIKEAIEKIVTREDLTYDEAYRVMNEIMSGKSTPTQNAAFLAALSTKSAKFETIDEISGCAAAMREHAIPVDTGDLKCLEIVGTGGDRSNSFNISTTASIVIAAGGQPVAKHVLQVWCRRLSGSARRQFEPDTGDLRAGIEGCRPVLFLRAEVSHVHEVCRRHPQGARLPHHL